MALGPPAVITRNCPDPGRANRVVLGPYDAEHAAPHFPFAPDDEAMVFTGPTGVRYLHQDTPADYMAGRVFSPASMSWGVWHDGRLVGFADLMERPSGVVTYGVLLAPEGRGKGIGGLVTAAVTGLAATPGVVGRYFKGCNPLPQTIETWIHPDNAVSRAMCERVGYIQMRHFTYRMEYNNSQYEFPWVGYLMPLTAKAAADSGVLPDRIEAAAAQRAAALQGYSIEQVRYGAQAAEKL